MNLSLLKIELSRDEGVRTKPYRDTVGKLTIGVGRNLDDVGLSTDEINVLLDGDIARTVAELNEKLPWWVAESEPRQRVLVNMAFNLGVSGLLGFRKMLDAVKESRFADASKEMLDSKWAEQVGNRAHRLAKMMEEG